MKMLVHRTADSEALPFVLDDLKEHIRVSDSDDDNAIINMGHTAAAEIEQFAQIALLTQTIRVTIFSPRSTSGMDLPIGPADSTNLPTITVDGAPFTDFAFERGARPYIRWGETFHRLDRLRLSIEYQAGFGASASDIPRDLAQALMDQSALHYDGRSPMDAKSLTTSPHMARVAARYRGVKI